MKAHFSNIQSVILRELDQAKQSIRIAVAWFTNAALFETVLNKCKEKVAVDIILNNDEINNNAWTRNNLEALLSHSCRLHWIEYPELMHQKFCIIDSGIVINGSYNWTNRAESHNRENIVIIDDAYIADAFNREFDKLCSLYPSSSELPRPGKSDIQPDIINIIQRQENDSTTQYESDFVRVKPESEWRGTNRLHFVLDLPLSSSAIISYVDTNKLETLIPESEEGKSLIVYDNTKRILSGPNEYFRLFAKQQSGNYHLKLKDGRTVKVDSGMTETSDSDAYILLYSNYRVQEVINRHTKFRNSKFRIPVTISVESTCPIDRLRLSIENMLGVKEYIEQNDAVFSYHSPPDENRYYIVASPAEDCEFSLKIKCHIKEATWKFKLNGGKTYYLGYICNLSKKYESEKIYFNKGIKR